MPRVKSVLIVGGGSSGWMAASGLAHTRPELDITLVESSDVPTVGVGEATLNSFHSFLLSVGLHEDEHHRAGRKRDRPERNAQAVDLLRTVGQESGKRQREQHLPELGRLEGEEADVDPPLRPSGRRAEDQHEPHHANEPERQG